MVKTDKFIGRRDELITLNQLVELRAASLVVITGRRRVGKTRLINEFAKDMSFYVLNGLPPDDEVTADMQREEFARQMGEQFNLPKLRADDWGDLFTTLANQTKRGRVVILLDEISWMAMDSPDFLGKLKTAWDVHFKKNPKLILVICGSVSSWIEENVLASTGYLGRPTMHMTLQELPLADCMNFWDKYKKNISAYEKFKTLSITGGIPRYLELTNPKLTAEENIQALLFNKNAYLLKEFKHVFVDVYGKRNGLYREIIEVLATGKATQQEIAEHRGVAYSGDIRKYLDDLIKGGFVAEDNTWNVKTGKISSLSYFRLKDNFTRFSLKYVVPNLARIEKGYFQEKSLRSLPAWDTILGLQFENLVLNNHELIKKIMGIQPQDIIFDNPFFQRKTTRYPGCQVDYMIQTQHDCVYVFEIKFKRKEIGMSVVEEVKEKLRRLSLPKHVSRRAILIHVNGVSDEVVDSGFFTKIIDFEELISN